jgi:hypothetical protein
LTIDIKGLQDARSNELDEQWHLPADTKPFSVELIFHVDSPMNFIFLRPTNIGHVWLILLVHRFFI